MVIAYFKQWVRRELDLQREAASASELRDNMVAEPGFHVPEIDWRRTARRVLTLEWLDGIKLSKRDELIAAGHDPKALAATLVRAFLRQAVVDGYFHADLHQGNLFALKDGRVAAVDFGIMGRIDRQARLWLAEILYGLITGNYMRVAEIHFEAQYVPPHHDVAEFATALRAVGEPIRGLPVKEISVGRMLEGLFSITRDFDMPIQPHLLLLQKTMVMEEGVATALDPDINMWEAAEPFLKDWLRTELGPEAYYADRIVDTVRAFKLIPDLIRRIDASLSQAGRGAAAAAAGRHRGDRAQELDGAAGHRPRFGRCGGGSDLLAGRLAMDWGAIRTRYRRLVEGTGACADRGAAGAAGRRQLVAGSAPAPKLRTSAAQQSDLQLYRDIIAGVKQAAIIMRSRRESLAQGNYPLKPFFTFRLPTHATALCHLRRADDDRGRLAALRGADAGLVDEAAAAPSAALAGQLS